MEIVAKYYAINNGINLGAVSKQVIVLEKEKIELLEDGTGIVHKYKEEHDFIIEDFDYINAIEVTKEQHEKLINSKDIDDFVSIYNEITIKQKAKK